jgi:hypothetical protein
MEVIVASPAVRGIVKSFLGVTFLQHSLPKP